MKSTCLFFLPALLSALGGCATDGPATGGASVRSIVAQQVAFAQPQRAPATLDGRAAVEVYKNYTGSYANPQPHSTDSAFGR